MKNKKKNVKNTLSPRDLNIPHTSNFYISSL